MMKIHMFYVQVLAVRLPWGHKVRSFIIFSSNDFTFKYRPLLLPPFASFLPFFFHPFPLFVPLFCFTSFAIICTYIFC